MQQAIKASDWTSLGLRWELVACNSMTATLSVLNMHVVIMLSKPQTQPTLPIKVAHKVAIIVQLTGVIGALLRAAGRSLNKNIPTYSTCMNYQDGICLRIEAHMQDKVKLTFRSTMTKHWIKKKSKISQSHNSEVHIHTQAQPTYGVLSGCEQKKQNYAQNTMIRLSLFITLNCINQAGSCLEVITMAKKTKKTYARTANLCLI